MRYSIVRWIPVAALFVGLPLATALDEMSASAEGRGAITIQNQSLPVERAEVSLIPGGRFILSLTGDERYVFRGQWQEQGNRILLTVAEAQGNPAQGSGELRLRGDRFRTIEIDAADRSFAASFRVVGAYKDFTAGATTDEVIEAPAVPPVRTRQPSGRDPVVSAPAAPAAPVAPKAPAPAGATPGVDAPKVTVQGSGAFTLGRDERKPIDAMEVFLEPDGRLRLKGFGPQGETVLTGTWRAGEKRAGQQRFELTIAPGDAAPTAGRGYVLVDNDGHIDQVSVQGGSRVFRTGYTLTFVQR